MGIGSLDHDGSSEVAGRDVGLLDLGALVSKRVKGGVALGEVKFVEDLTR